MKHWKWSVLNVPVFSAILFVMIITFAPQTVSGDLYPNTLTTARGDLYPRAQSTTESVPPAGIKNIPTPKPPAVSPAPPPPGTPAPPKSPPAKATGSTSTSKTLSSTTTAKKTTSSTTIKQTTSKATQSSRSSTSTSSSSLSQTTSQISKASAIIATAKQYIGVKYVYGGTTPSGFDCSGYVQYVFAKNGITLPRVSRDQYKIGTSVSFSSLRAGDLVFFSLAKNGIVDHEGIYVGNGQFINASSSKGVTIYTLGPYWQSAFLGARRVL